MKKCFKKIFCLLLSIVLLISNTNLYFAGDSGTSAEGEHTGGGSWDKMFPPYFITLGFQVEYYDISGAKQWQEIVYHKEVTSTVVQERSEDGNIVEKITIPKSVFESKGGYKVSKHIPKVGTNNQSGWTWNWEGGGTFTAWGNNKEEVKAFLSDIGHGDEVSSEAPGTLFYIDTASNLSESFLMKPLTIVYLQANINEGEENGKVKLTVDDGANGILCTNEEIQSLAVPSKTKNAQKWALYIEPGGTNAGIQAVKQLLGITSVMYGAGIVTGWSFGSGGGGGGGGTTPTPSGGSGETPNTGSTATMDLYDDELSYFYSLTNSSSGANREIKAIINVGGNPHSRSVSCAKGGSHSCSSKTSGDFTVTVGHTTTGDTCIILGKHKTGAVEEYGGTNTFTKRCTEQETWTVVTDLNQWVTGYRDKAQDLRTAWQGSTYAMNSGDITEQLAKYGISQGYAPTDFIKTTGEGQFTTPVVTNYDISISGQTEMCPKDFSHTYKDGCGDKDNPCPGHDCSAHCDGGGVGGTIDASKSAINSTHNATQMKTDYQVGQETSGEYINDEYDHEMRWVNGSDRPSMTLYAEGKSETFGFENSHDTSEIMKTQNFVENGTIEFYPYVKMSFASLDYTSFREAYIVSENKSSVKDYTIVNVAVMNPGNNASVGVKPTISVSSSNWIGDYNAMKYLESKGVFSKNGNDRQVLVPGGATMFLFTDRSKNEKGSVDAISNRTPLSKIGVESYFTCVSDAMCSAVQTYSYPESEVMEATEEFFDDVENNLDHYYLTKYISEGIYTTEDEFMNSSPVCVDGEEQVSNFGSGSRYNTLDRSHSKYYLGFNNPDKYNESDIDVECLAKTIDKYTLRSDTEGIVYFEKNGSVQGQLNGKELKSGNSANVSTINSKIASFGSNKEWQTLNKDTGFVDNYIETLDFNMGKSGSHSGKRTSAGWYNEGFEGISIIRGVAWYQMYVSDMRMEVVDPVLCGIQGDEGLGKNDLYGERDEKKQWRTFRYQLSNKSKGGDHYYIGTLGDCDCYLDEIQSALKSKLMYMSNVTVHDTNAH